MKRQIFAAVIVCVLCMGVTAFAEKKNILVKTYLNVQVDELNNYQVNSVGDIVTYTIAKDNFGIITTIRYTYTKKSGSSVLGEIGPGPKITDDFIPANAISFEIVGLERNVALVLFNDDSGNKIYMVFRLASKYATPTPNRVNPIQHIAIGNEICSITSSQVLSYIDNPAVVKTVSFRERTKNIATLTTSTNHGLSLGDKVTILDVPDNSYNLANVEVLSVPTLTTFTYSCPGIDEGSVGSIGTAYRPEAYKSVTVYNHNWTPQSSKGISNGWGTVSIINLILQKYYKGIEQTVNPDELEVSILKP
ncbi:MAG: hypothetical protein NT118_14985 [Lentisphaerae bacterium]|nr:hypothetical protein [Lentisphaerota bacterium]